MFVRDLDAATTTLVSVSSAGVQGDEPSELPSISADGRRIAFQSFSENLVAGDTGALDIFVRDLDDETTVRVNVSNTGEGALNDTRDPSISADGRRVGFSTHSPNLVDGDTNGTADVFVHDLDSATTERVSVDSAGNEGNSGSFRPSLSADGRYVAFDSGASNLVAGDTNGSVRRVRA